jgi:hypothetical protein
VICTECDEALEGELKVIPGSPEPHPFWGQVDSEWWKFNLDDMNCTFTRHIRSGATAGKTFDPVVAESEVRDHSVSWAVIPYIQEEE